MDNEQMQLGDDVIGQIAKLIQLAILTGTDIVDNLRSLKLVYDEDKSKLSLSPSYVEIAESQIQKLVEEATSLQVE